MFNIRFNLNRIDCVWYKLLSCHFINILKKLENEKGFFKKPTSMVFPIKERQKTVFPAPFGPITWHLNTRRLVDFSSISILLSLVILNNNLNRKNNFK